MHPSEAALLVQSESQDTRNSVRPFLCSDTTQLTCHRGFSTVHKTCCVLLEDARRDGRVAASRPENRCTLFVTRGGSVKPGLVTVRRILLVYWIYFGDPVCSILALTTTTHRLDDFSQIAHVSAHSARAPGLLVPNVGYRRPGKGLQESLQGEGNAFPPKEYTEYSSVGIVSKVRAKA